MAAPKECPPLPFISLTMIRHLAIGESIIVSACDPTAVSAAFKREKPREYTQQMVLVVNPRSAECQKMFIVKRES